jgi:hypothetical protein
MEQVADSESHSTHADSIFFEYVSQQMSLAMQRLNLEID